MNLEIGTFAYPTDNSYSFNWTKDEETKEYLAGREEPYEPAKLVEIESEPYMQFAYRETRNGWYRDVEYEFVNVRYNGNLYRVLNRFTMKLDKSENHTKSRV